MKKIISVASLVLLVVGVFSVKAVVVNAQDVAACPVGYFCTPITQVKITAPNGGENFVLGKQIYVVWNTLTGAYEFKPDSKVVIYLSKGSSVVKTFDNLVNDGNEYITIPSDLSIGTDYSLTVVVYSKNPEGMQSNRTPTFAINSTNARLTPDCPVGYTCVYSGGNVSNSEPVVTVLYPQMGYILENSGQKDSGKIATIRWSVSKNISDNTIGIILTDGKGNFIKYIANKLKNTGSYDWKYDPTIKDGAYGIEVYIDSVKGGLGNTAKSGVFTIGQRIVDNSNAEGNNRNLDVCKKFDRDMAMGIRGDDVKDMQEFLIKNGFDISTSASGNFDEPTKNAVIKYQRSVGLPGSGFFGPLTRGSANSRSSICAATAVYNPIETPGASSQLAIGNVQIVNKKTGVVASSVVKGETYTISWTANSVPSSSRFTLVFQSPTNPNVYGVLKTGLLSSTKRSYDWMVADYMLENTDLRVGVQVGDTRAYSQTFKVLPAPSASPSPTPTVAPINVPVKIVDETTYNSVDKTYAFVRLSIAGYPTNTKVDHWVLTYTCLSGVVLDTGNKTLCDGKEEGKNSLSYYSHNMYNPSNDYLMITANAVNKNFYSSNIKFALDARDSNDRSMGATEYKTITLNGQGSASPSPSPTLLGAPTIKSITPASAIAGTKVAVNVANPNKVPLAYGDFLFGNYGLPNFTVVNNETITFTIPPEATAGQYKLVWFKASAGMNTMSFTVLPSVSGLNPMSGKPGSKVTMSIPNPKGFALVYGDFSFGNYGLPNFSLVNNNTITFTVPSDAKPGIYDVSWFGGESYNAKYTVTQ